MAANKENEKLYSPQEIITNELGHNNFKISKDEKDFTGTLLHRDSRYVYLKNNYWTPGIFKRAFDAIRGLFTKVEPAVEVVRLKIDECDGRLRKGIVGDKFSITPPDASQWRSYRRERARNPNVAPPKIAAHLVQQSPHALTEARFQELERLQQSTPTAPRSESAKLEQSINEKNTPDQTQALSSTILDKAAKTHLDKLTEQDKEASVPQSITSSTTLPDSSSQPDTPQISLKRDWMRLTAATKGKLNLKAETLHLLHAEFMETSNTNGRHYLFDVGTNVEPCKENADSKVLAKDNETYLVRIGPKKDATAVAILSGQIPPDVTLEIGKPLPKGFKTIKAAKEIKNENKTTKRSNKPTH